MSSCMRPCCGSFGRPDAQMHEITALNLCCSEMCVSQTRVLFLSLSCSGASDLSVYNKSEPALLLKWASWCAQEGVLNNAISTL